MIQLKRTPGPTRPLARHTYNDSMRIRYFLITMAFLLLAGCSQSQFVVVEPTEFARTVELQHTFIQKPPIDYQLFVENGRLRMFVNNHANTPVRIIGGDSYVVDFNQQSFALGNRTIPAGSFVAFTMPPRRPRGGGGIGFGVGAGGGSNGTFGGVGVGTGNSGFTGGDDPPYYDWPRGDLRMHLSIEHDGQRLEHEFLFRREQRSN